MKLFRCARCALKHPQTGSGIRVVLKMRRKVCKRCAAFIDRMKRRVARLNKVRER